MKALSGREFCRVLERHGWTLLRVQGSHHVYGKAGIATRLSVPVHAGQTLKPGLQRAFMKSASLTDADG